MPFEIVRDDITRMEVDAIVNPSDEALSGGGGVDGAIHRAAGPGLLAECRALHGCAPGEAKITKAYRLPCKHVIHTVGPVWRGGRQGEQARLAACYRNALELAVKNGCESIAFPLISSGAFGFPREKALKTATGEIRRFLSTNDLRVFLVIFDRASFLIGQKLHNKIKQYIGDAYAEERIEREPERRRRRPSPECGAEEREEKGYEAPAPAAPAAASLDEALKQMDETFSRMVLRKIREKGLSEVACYRRANLDRKLFSKIRSGIHYAPSKKTALALAIALELPIAEARELLGKAGLALSHSSKFDIIVEYFIIEGIYKIDTINQTLFDFGQPLLGV